MQDICKQIHKSKPPRNPGYGAQTEKPNPTTVQPLDLTVLVAPENLKVNNNNTIKSCAKRECQCEFATARKPPLRPQNVKKEKDILNKVQGFLALPSLHEQQVGGEEFTNDENNENRASSHRWNSDSFTIAKYCEAKLEEAFQSDTASDTCSESPDVQRTKACFQVLEELCENKLPFSSVLRHICDELRRATYHITQDSSNGASGTQERAYFEVARELEGEIAQMEAENSDWQSRLSAQTQDLMIARGELQELDDELAETDKASNELKEKLSSTVQALSFEKNKVNVLHEKIENLKKELKQIRHEVKHAQQIETVKDKEVEEFEKRKASYMQLVHEFQHAQAFLHSAQCEVAESASKEDLIAAKAEILELEEKISQVRAQVAAFEYETRCLTPRPQWGRQVPGMDKPQGVSTAQQIEKICRENAFLAASASRLQLDFAATEVTLAEVQETEKNNTKSEKIAKPVKDSNPRKSRGRSKPKEKAEI